MPLPGLRFTHVHQPVLQGRLLLVLGLALCLLVVGCNIRSGGEGRGDGSPERQAGTTVTSLSGAANSPPVPRLSDSVVVLAGSGSNIPITRKLVRAYVEEMTRQKDGKEGFVSPRFLVPDSLGSAGGIKALLEGAVDGALISRPIKDSEAELGLVEYRFALTTVCFIASGHVLDADLSLTSQEVFAILKGTRRWWKESGREIMVVVREAGDSSNLVLEKNWPGFMDLLADMFTRKQWRVAYTDREMLSLVESIPGGFGVADLGVVRSAEARVGVVALDGVTPEQVLAGWAEGEGAPGGGEPGGPELQVDRTDSPGGVVNPYQLRKVLSLVTGGNEKSGGSPHSEEVARFVQWTLTSPVAHGLLKVNGYLPMGVADSGAAGD